MDRNGICFLCHPDVLGVGSFRLKAKSDTPKRARKAKCTTSFSKSSASCCAVAACKISLIWWFWSEIPPLLTRCGLSWSLASPSLRFRRPDSNKKGVQYEFWPRQSLESSALILKKEYAGWICFPNSQAKSVSTSHVGFFGRRCEVQNKICRQQEKSPFTSLFKVWCEDAWDAERLANPSDSICRNAVMLSHNVGMLCYPFLSCLLLTGASLKARKHQHTQPHTHMSVWVYLSIFVYICVYQVTCSGDRALGI